MNSFVYNGGKVFGNTVDEARYNALLETFYNSYPELQRKVKEGKNYYERDPNTAELLRQRVLGEGVYIPDEDEDILNRLIAAYKSVKYATETCMTQADEATCKNLKFKGMNRCEYEKKWFSYIRGGNCFIDESIVKHILNNLSSYIKINWDEFQAKLVSRREGKLPNPDQLTKLDLINLLHDLTYHSKVLLKDIDLIAALEDKHKMSLVDFSTEMLLYYTYLFSFIVYVAKFLTSADFKKFSNKKNLTRVATLLNREPTKTNLAEFIYFVFSVLPRRTKEPRPGLIERLGEKPWSFSVAVGSVLLVLLLTYIPPSEIYKMISENRETILYKAYGMPTTKEDIAKELLGYLF